MTESLLTLLIDVSIKSTVLIGAGWLVTFCMHRRSAAERHTVWLLTLAGVLLMPLIAAVGPRLELALPATEMLETVTAVFEREAARPLTDAPASAVPTQSGAAGGAMQATRSAAVQAAAAQAAAAPLRVTLAQSLLIIYACVACVLALRYIGMRFRVARYLRSLNGIDDTVLNRRMDVIRADFAVRRNLVLLRSERDQSPWAWGSLRPRLVVPAEFSSWSVDQQNHAFMHELAHIARNDHLAGMLAQLCCVIYWFNPLAWLAVRRLLLEAEKASDDRVINAGGSAAAYAQQLLQIAERVFKTNSRSVWISAMAHRSSLSPRVRSILDPNNRRSAMSKFRTTIFAVTACAVVIPLATLQSQEPVADISDSEFQLLVQNGPNGSAELERIVDAYMANDLQSFAADAIARFVLGEYGIADEDGCEFCIEVFASEATPRQHEHFRVMIAAFDLIEQRAAAENSGDVLLQAALGNIVSSGNAHAMKRATYYVVRATQLGIDAQLSLSVVGFLYEQGNIAAARDLAAYLFESEASPHYRSEAAQQWQSFLDSEMGRRESVAQMIFDSLGVNPQVSDGDYLPVVKTPPVYPADAAEMGLEGHVVVEFTVDTTGKPADVSVVDSTNSLFNESALLAAREFRYAPRVLAGVPVEVPGVRNRITYRLDR